MKITSIPKLVSDLGMNFQDYENIAKNIKRMSLISSEARQRILDRANKNLSAELRKKAFPLIEQMAYDRQVFKIAGLKYSNGPPEGKGLFVTAIADYLLKNKNIQLHN